MKNLMILMVLLGLAIVKKNADLNDWTVLYTFSNILHSFSVKFQ